MDGQWICAENNANCRECACQGPTTSCSCPSKDHLRYCGGQNPPDRCIPPPLDPPIDYGACACGCNDAACFQVEGGSCANVPAISIYGLALSEDYTKLRFRCLSDGGCPGENAPVPPPVPNAFVALLEPSPSDPPGTETYRVNLATSVASPTENPEDQLEFEIPWGMIHRPVMYFDIVKAVPQGEQVLTSCSGPGWGIETSDFLPLSSQDSEGNPALNWQSCKVSPITAHSQGYIEHIQTVHLMSADDMSGQPDSALGFTEEGSEESPPNSGTPMESTLELSTGSDLNEESKFELHLTHDPTFEPTKAILLLVRGNGGGTGAPILGGAFLRTVEFKKMWETKNKANQVFNATRKDDPITMPSPAPDAAGSVHGIDSNHLYIVSDPFDDKLGVTVDVSVHGDPTKWIAAAFDVGNKVSGSDTVFPASGPVEMRIPHGDVLAIRVGYDANDNSLLDTSEEVKLSMPAKFDKSAAGEPIVKGLSSTKYSAMSTTANGVIAVGYTIPHSTEFLRLFRDGTTIGMPDDWRPYPTDKFTMDVFNGELSEWITHNSGAAFSDEGVADIPFHHWRATTSAGEMAGLSYTVKTAVHSHFDATIMPQVTAHFASLPPGAQADFPQGTLATITHTHESTPTWVPRTTVSFDNPYLPNLGGDDAFGVIGRGRVSRHQAKYTVKEIEYDQYVGDDANGGPIFQTAIGYEVTARTVGSVGDLYDFNFNAGGVNEIGATLQLGYGKGTYGRTAGKIYRWDIEWDETFDWFKQ